MDYQEILTKLKDVGLDMKTATRIEPLNAEEVAIDINPYSDVVNLLPVVLAASINDINALTDDKGKIELFTTVFADQVLAEAFKEFELSKVEQSILKNIKKLKDSQPALFTHFIESFFINMLMTYAASNKFGFRSCPKALTGKSYFQYFALLDVLYQLSEETQTMIINDLGNKSMWSVTAEDLEDCND